MKRAEIDILLRARHILYSDAYYDLAQEVGRAIDELSALRAAQVGACDGAGWVLVPPEPTEAMEAAYERAYSQKAHDIYSPTPTEHYEDGGGAFGYGYRAMLKAAPAVGADVGAGADQLKAPA